MKTFRSLLALVMALCLALGASCALADQTLEGDANVDQRYYPAVTPFIHPPFYNVKLAVEVDDHGVITNVTDNGTGGAGSFASIGATAATSWRGLAEAMPEAAIA